VAGCADAASASVRPRESRKQLALHNALQKVFCDRCSWIDGDGVAFVHRSQPAFRQPDDDFVSSRPRSACRKESRSRTNSIPAASPSDRRRQRPRVGRRPAGGRERRVVSRTHFARGQRLGRNQDQHLILQVLNARAVRINHRRVGCAVERPQINCDTAVSSSKKGAEPGRLVHSDSTGRLC